MIKIGFIQNTIRFVLNKAGFVPNITGFVLYETDLVQNKISFVLKTGFIPYKTIVFLIMDEDEDDCVPAVP